MHPGWKEEAKRALDEREMEECTFAPNIHIRSNPESKVIELNLKARPPTKQYDKGQEEEI